MENVVSLLRGTAQTLISRATSDTVLAEQLRAQMTRSFEDFPWCLEFRDWTGASYSLGGEAKHWNGQKPLEIVIKTPAAGRDLLGLDIMRFLERFLDEEVDLTGNLYLFPEMRNHTKLDLKPWQIVWNRLQNRVMQDPTRAVRSVRSHYDIPQEALFYLDRVYQSYSCGIWEKPYDLSLDHVLTIGKGEGDALDTLERAQWRKFQHAADYLSPAANESVLDVGCGYPGFMNVLMDRQPGRVVGWTASENQYREGLKMLEGRDPARFELRCGDYREDRRVFDHIHSTGMICHVGPEGPHSGLSNYVREVRSRIRTGGRYVHHCMMTPYTETPLFDQVGPAFNRKYVWPGFNYYTLGEHVTALERNGFQIVRVFNISPHYAKTTRAWYERMMAERERFVRHAGEATCRAWQIFLAGITGSYLNRQIHTMRVFAEAVDIESPSGAISDPAKTVSARLPVD